MKFIRMVAEHFTMQLKNLKSQGSIAELEFQLGETLDSIGVYSNGMDTSLHFCDRYRKSINSLDGENMMSECSIIGIDLAKNSFHIHGANRNGRELFSRRVSRAKLSNFIVKQKPCRIAMEACAGAHFWARKFVNMGHEVVLIAPQFIKPYVKGDKSDSADAEAICEAASRENMRFVPVKTRSAQDLCALTRIRDLCVKNSTALSNQIRGLLAEYGVVAPKGKSALRTLLAQLSDVNISSIGKQEWGDLTPVMVCELSQLYEELW